MRVRPLNLETPKVTEEVEAPLKKVPVPVEEAGAWHRKHWQNRLLDVGYHSESWTSTRGWKAYDGMQLE